jgi:hypothetical protein
VKIRRERLADMVWPFILVLAGVKYLAGLGAIEDVPVFSSEASYLGRGVNLLHAGVVDRADSPIYSVWYYVLSLAVPDTLDLYLASHAVLSVATAPLMYLLLRALKTPPLLAALGASAFLVSNVQFAPPFNGLFALVLMLVFLNWAMRCRSEENGYVVMAAGTLLMTFARNEYLASLMLFALWLVALVLFDKWRGRPALTPARIARIGAVLLLIVVALAVLRHPQGATKQRFAFCVSYYERQVLSHGMQVLGTTGRQFPFDCEAVMRPVFGDEATIPALLASNPPAYIRFLLDNAAGYMMGTILMPFVTPFVFLSPFGQTVLVYLELGLLLWSLALIGRSAVAAGARQFLAAALPRTFVVSAAIIALANVLAAVLYFPRLYYLLPQTGLLCCLFFALLSSALPGAPPVRGGFHTAIVTGLLLLVLVPNHVHGWWRPFRTAEGADTGAPDQKVLGRRFEVVLPLWPMFVQFWSGQHFSIAPSPLDELQPGEILANRRTIEFIRSLNIRTPVHVWGVGGYPPFLSDNYFSAGIGPFGSQTVGGFVRDRHVDLVVRNRRLDAYFRARPDFQDFVQNPDVHGFVRLGIPGSVESLLIAKSLSENPDTSAEAGRE